MRAKTDAVDAKCWPSWGMLLYYNQMSQPQKYSTILESYAHFVQRWSKTAPGYFHIDIAELRTNESKLYLFVAIDRTSKFAMAQLVDNQTARRPGSF